jgi:hypothetical protein
MQGAQNSIFFLPHRIIGHIGFHIGIIYAVVGDAALNTNNRAYSTALRFKRKGGNAREGT